MSDPSDLDQLRAEVKNFIDERNWSRFHNPKNLSMSIAIEAAELMELFQWLDFEESNSLPLKPGNREKIEDEMSDVFVYLLSLSNTLNIDLIAAARRKMAKNARKYPDGDQTRGAKMT